MIRIYKVKLNNFLSWGKYTEAKRKQQAFRKKNFATVDKFF